MNTQTQVVAVLEKAQKDGFYGQIELEFQSGRVVLIRKTESFKPDGNNPTHASKY